jgi:hypothetical protein
MAGLATMKKAVASLLARFGTACTVSEVATTTRNAATGAVTTTTTTHTGKAYRQMAMKDTNGLNPSVSAVLIVQLSDDYVIKPKDLITHNGYTNQQVLQVHTVNPAEGLAYQKIGV